MTTQDEIMDETKTDEPAAPVAVFKKRGVKGKSNFRKRPATPLPADSDSDGDYSSSEDESGHKIKRRKKNTGTVTASSRKNTGPQRDLSATVFAADRSAVLSNSNDATKQSNWYDEEPKDAMSAKILLGSTRAMYEGTYRGLANQTSFIQKNPDAPTRSVGPVKASTNVRTITVTDFAPDVCKDYKQSGWCGFGDSCKYLHAREDYKAGWQLDREWENVTKGNRNLGGTTVASASRDKMEDEEDEGDDALLETIPFVCTLCREEYKNPVQTRCGHFFCEACALSRYRRDPSCGQCGAGTNGIFNSGKRLQKLLSRKRNRAARQRQEAIDRGEERSDEEDEE